MAAALSAGVGLKPEHFADALAANARGLWFEVHAENYMVEGGARLRWLDAIRTRHPVSVHGVGLSLAADAGLDAAHLRRVAALVRRVEPALVSEHLAWSAWRGAYYPDLLPFPRTSQSLARVAANVEQLQDAIGCRVAVENPSHYLRIDAHEWDEIDFLSELARRTGCALLLDVNNVYVSARNLRASARAYIDAFPAELVAEIHLAGHSEDPALGEDLLVDSHDAAVAPAVWALYERLVARIGPRPTLIERDGNVPAFADLMAERELAHAVLCTRHAEAA
ncbi:MAG: DUF692 domain-containing protein [Burkholderiales bacterium]